MAIWLFQPLAIGAGRNIVGDSDTEVYLLRRSTLFISTIAFIGAFQTVDHIFVLTQGEPSGSSTVLLYYLWQERFENLDIGKSSALTIILIVILLIFTITNFRITEEKGERNA